jgi:hypothetical protein
VIEGKGCKAKHFARENHALRRGQRRPAYCVGETYAVVIVSHFWVVLSAGLCYRGFASVAANHASRRTHA